MRLKIQGHGGHTLDKYHNIRVVDTDTGEMLERVTKVDIHADIESCWAVITIVNPDIDIETNGQIENEASE